MLLFVTVMVAAELTAFTDTEPKRRELGATPTFAAIVTGKNSGLATNNPANRHTRRAMFIPWQPLLLAFERVSDGGGYHHAAQNYFLILYI